MRVNLNPFEMQHEGRKVFAAARFDHREHGIVRIAPMLGNSCLGDQISGNNSSSRRFHFQRKTAGQSSQGGYLGFDLFFDTRAANWMSLAIRQR